MSWPRFVSGGGQVFPSNNQQGGNLLQMMQLQLQMQHNIQMKKQMEYNPPKNQGPQNHNKNFYNNNAANKQGGINKNEVQPKQNQSNTGGNKNEALNQKPPEKLPMKNESPSKANTGQALNPKMENKNVPKPHEAKNIPPKSSPSKQEQKPGFNKDSQMDKPMYGGIKNEIPKGQGNMNQPGNYNNFQNNRPGNKRFDNNENTGHWQKQEPAKFGGGQKQEQPAKYGGGQKQEPAKYGGGQKQEPIQYGGGQKQEPAKYGGGQKQEPNQYGGGQKQEPAKYGGGNKREWQGGPKNPGGNFNNHPKQFDDNRQGRNMRDRSLERPARGGGGQRGGYGNDWYKDKLDQQTFEGPMVNLEPIDIKEKKFSAYSKIFIGNIPKTAESEEILALFRPYGELGPTYINKDSAFGFIYLDYKANAAKAVREVDNASLKNRYLKVRFAIINEGLRVRNLSPYISNEMLEKAFSVFGQIESSRVIVDDRGNPKNEGVVVFKEKKSASIALKKCQEDCFFLCGAMRPAIVTPLEPVEDNVEGVPETVIPKNDDYKAEREIPPHFADLDSFEFEFGNQWKKLFAMYDDKKSVLDRDFQIELERLEKKMVLAKVEYETDKLRKELAQREAESAQLRRHFGGASDDYSYGASGSYSSVGGSQGAFDSYGANEHRGGYGFESQYNEGYGGERPVDSAGGGYSDMGYSQPPAGNPYSAGYGRDDYAALPPVDGYPAAENYNRASYETLGGRRDTPSQPSPVAAAQTFRNSPVPEPPSIKRPRY